MKPGVIWIPTIKYLCIKTNTLGALMYVSFPQCTLTSTLIDLCLYMPVYQTHAYPNTICIYYVTEFVIYTEVE